METELIFEAIRTINKHIAIINDELGFIKIDIVVLQTQMTEIMWLMRAITGAFIVLTVGQLWKLMVSVRNHMNKNKGE